MPWLAAVLLALLTATLSSANPRIVTQNGNILITVPENANVQLVRVNAQGSMIGAPEAVVTQTQLDAVVANFSSALAQIRAQMLQINTTAVLTGSSVVLESSRALRAEQSVSEVAASDASRAVLAVANETSRALAAEGTLSSRVTSLSVQIPLSNSRIDALSTQAAALAGLVNVQNTSLSSLQGVVATHTLSLAQTALDISRVQNVQTSLNATVSGLASTLASNAAQTLAEFARVQLLQNNLNSSLLSLATQYGLLSTSVSTQLFTASSVATSTSAAVAQSLSVALDNTASTSRSLNSSLFSSLSTGLADLNSRLAICFTAPTVASGTAAACAGFASGRPCTPVCNTGFRLASSTLLCDGGAWTGSASCTACTAISNCAQTNCTTASNQVCLTCNAGYQSFSTICAITARYWRLRFTGVTVGHYPRVSRYVLSRAGTGAIITISSLAADNCGDSGTIDGVGFSVGYDAGTPTAIAAGGFYTVFSGLRGGVVVLEYSADNSNWTQLASRDIQTTNGCGIYLTDGTRP